MSRSYKAKSTSDSTQDAVPSSLFILLLYDLLDHLSTKKKPQNGAFTVPVKTFAYTANTLAREPVTSRATILYAVLPDVFLVVLTTKPAFFISKMRAGN